MATIPKRVEDRLIAGLKKFQTVLTAVNRATSTSPKLTINSPAPFATP